MRILMTRMLVTLVAIINLSFARPDKEFKVFQFPRTGGKSIRSKVWDIVTK